MRRRARPKLLRRVGPKRAKLLDGQKVVANLDGVLALNPGEPTAPQARNKNRPGDGVEGRSTVGHPGRTKDCWDGPVWLGRENDRWAARRITASGAVVHAPWI